MIRTKSVRASGCKIVLHSCSENDSRVMLEFLLSILLSPPAALSPTLSPLHPASFLPVEFLRKISLLTTHHALISFVLLFSQQLQSWQ